ncbi:MAG: hypothetical protein PWP27_910 [Clostridiales bacterium]|jgi:hypothetical protein|nr:hypothetical protein [Clostridiales bacterium]MDK2933100.1 hypothetical protein [Clostridiales bacterium]
MLKLWGKMIKNNRIIEQYTAEYAKNDLSKSEMVNLCVEEICREFDIQKPMWFPLNVKDFAKYGRTVFKADNFIEEIEFDSFEVELLDDEIEKKR